MGSARATYADSWLKKKTIDYEKVDLDLAVNWALLTYSMYWMYHFEEARGRTRSWTAKLASYCTGKNSSRDFFKSTHLPLDPGVTKLATYLFLLWLFDIICDSFLTATIDAVKSLHDFVIPGTWQGFCLPWRKQMVLVVRRLSLCSFRISCWIFCSHHAGLSYLMKWSTGIGII